MGGKTDAIIERCKSCPSPCHCYYDLCICPKGLRLSAFETTSSNIGQEKVTDGIPQCKPSCKLPCHCYY
ncbi:hypothetical protein LINPERHAP1_LOCUS16735, partial [Linum perenne]